MNKIKTEIHDTIDRIKGMRGTATNNLKKGELIFLIIILAFTILPFISLWGLTVLGFTLGITAYISSVVFSVGGYKYLRSKTQNRFWDRLTIISLSILIVLFSPVIVFSYIFNLLAIKFHLNNLRRYPYLIWVRSVLLLLTFSTILSTSVLLPDDNFEVQLIFVLVFVVYSVLKKLLVYFIVYGDERRYSRYKINCEFKYLDDFNILNPI